MKVSLIVASGVHQGKTIPVVGPKFLIGRDPQCQLRPASQVISKVHCGLLVRDGKVFAVDFGSTNGTSVNDVQLKANEECEVKNGDRIKAGPLDFTLKLSTAKSSDSTPLPADLKPVASPAADKLKEAATGKPAPAKANSDDDIAAMLLSLGDDDSGTSSSDIPGGSTTIMEMPISTAEPTAAATDKKDDKKPIPTREGSSNAASELLRKYMKRPR